MANATSACVTFSSAPTSGTNDLNSCAVEYPSLLRLCTSALNSACLAFLFLIWGSLTWTETRRGSPEGQLAPHQP